MVFDYDDVLQQAASWLDAGYGVALATVVRTWGSSPRPAGSQLAVDDQGRFVGSVSGGCVETAVVTEAREVISSGKPRLLSYGVTNEMAWEVGLACGGQIEVYLERADRVMVSNLIQAKDANQARVLATALDSGEQALIDPWGLTSPPGISEALFEAARIAAARDESEAVDLDGRQVFLKVFNPPLRLVLVGAVHIAQPLSRMAGLAGFEVVVVDPRSSFASPERFPGVVISTDWPAEAMAMAVPDRRTAVVALTHDPKLDDPALTAALRSEAFYVGALGSRKTHASRLERLRQAGLDDAALSRIRGPVGLNIGARSPAEIAVAILSEVIQTLRLGALAPSHIISAVPEIPRERKGL